MKYLIQHKKEFFITILLFITYATILIWAVWSIVHGTFDFKNFFSIIMSVISYFGWYYNMPTSEENSVKTGEMRMMKAGTYADDEMQGIGDEDPFDEDEGDDDDDI